MKIQYKDYLIIKENNTVKITNGIGTIVIDKELLKKLEIIEEKKTKPLTKKDIEALGYAYGEIQKCFTNGWTKSLENKPLEEKKEIPEKLNISNFPRHNNSLKKTAIKVNEIIDYLKSKGE